MFVSSVLLIFSFFETLGARQSDIDINRIVLLPPETSNIVNQSFINQDKRSVNTYRTNVNDDRSSWYTVSHAPLRLHDASPNDPKTTIKVHQPREDPRLFYQSDSYLKEINGKNLNNEISFIYPGREVVRADDKEYNQNHRSASLLMKQWEQNKISDGYYNFCVRCPHDRTLVAKPGSDRVILQHPALVSCSGQRSPRNIRFMHMYGPKFGSLIEQGSHTIVGRIMYKNKSLRLCKMHIHVVVQGCTTPEHLLSHCGGDRTKPCNFTCRDPNSDLYGETSLICEDNMKWNGDLPICKVPTWCDPPPPPEHGHVSCKGATAGYRPGLAEGAKCRVRCARGWRGGNPRAVAVCRRGYWTHALTCQPKKNFTSDK